MGNKRNVARIIVDATKFDSRFTPTNSLLMNIINAIVLKDTKSIVSFILSMQEGKIV